MHRRVTRIPGADSCLSAVTPKKNKCLTRTETSVISSVPSLVPAPPTPCSGGLNTVCRLWLGSILLANSSPCCLHSCPVSSFARLRYSVCHETSCVCIQIGTTQHMCVLAFRSSRLRVDKHAAQELTHSDSIQRGTSPSQPCTRQRAEGLYPIRAAGS